MQNVYIRRHPIPANMSGLGDMATDLLGGQLSSVITQATKVGIENAWPTIEAKSDALVAKYKAQFMVPAILIGGMAVIALALSIKRELGK